MVHIFLMIMNLRQWKIKIKLVKDFSTQRKNLSHNTYTQLLTFKIILKVQMNYLISIYWVRIALNLKSFF